MKTQTGVNWAVRQWMLRGGDGTIAWFLGPELDRAWVLVEKFADGEGDNPPVCPPALIRSRPSSKDAHHPEIEMIDGTLIQIRHMGAGGKNLTARGIIFGLATEMATASSAMNFVRLRGRIAQSRGQIYLDAVPEPRNWVKTAIIDAATTERDEQMQAIARGQQPEAATYRIVQLSQAINPWVDAAESAAFHRDLHRIDPRIAAREAGGEFVDDRDAWLPMFDAARHTFDSNGRDPIEALGLEDATEQASLRLFSSSRRHIVAVDVNARPHTALICKIAAPAGIRHDHPGRWQLVAIDGLQLFGVDSLEAATELAAYRGGRYAGAGVVMDATSMLERHNSGGALNLRQNIIPHESYHAAGFEVRGPARQQGDATRFANPSKFDSSLVVRALFRDGRVHIDRANCQPLIYAIRNQVTEEDGTTPEKKPNTVQDRRIAAWTDALRYITWPFFGLSPSQRSGVPHELKVYG